MAYKEKEIEKLYYSIGEVAEIFSVAPSLIRFWESEFELIKPKNYVKTLSWFVFSRHNVFVVARWLFDSGSDNRRFMGLQEFVTF